MTPIRYRSGYKYRLVEPYSVELDIRPVEPIDTNDIALTTPGLLTVKKAMRGTDPVGADDRHKKFHALLGVRKEAGFSASPESKKPVLEAP